MRKWKKEFEKLLRNVAVKDAKGLPYASEYLEYDQAGDFVGYLWYLRGRTLRKCTFKYVLHEIKISEETNLPYFYGTSLYWYLHDLKDICKTFVKSKGKFRTIEDAINDFLNFEVEKTAYEGSSLEVISS